MSGGPIEAGCSYNGTQLPGDVGASFLEPGRPAYRGSTRFGIQSSDYGAYGRSYRLERP